MDLKAKTCFGIGLLIAFVSPSFAAENSPPKHERPPSTPAATGTAPAIPDDLREARSEVYRRVGNVELKLHIFFPPEFKTTDKRPAIVFFFGGSWLRGTAGQFAPQCKYLAARGMVAAATDYRVYSRDRARVVDCTSDAQAAIRWMRAHARELGVDPDRIAAGGGSAGGHLAAATATVQDFTDEADKSISIRPNALVLFNPVIDLTPDEAGPGSAAIRHLDVLGRLGAKPEELSPMDHVHPGLPPTIIFHGKDDTVVPFVTIEAFDRAMKTAGNRCEVVAFEGQGHGFYNPDKNAGRFYKETLRLTDQFLNSLGYLKGEPTIKTEAK